MPERMEIQATTTAQGVCVAALYQFTPVAEPDNVRRKLYALCKHHGLRGTLLLASEGINGTVAGTPSGIEALHRWLTTEGGFHALEYKESQCEYMPFHRMKVRVKREIVSLGIPGIDPCRNGGQHVDAGTWNELIRDPDVALIDTRNDYEVELGSFPTALNPETASFHDFPAFIETHRQELQDKKIAMFCTGGIRCEKASAWLLENGFEKVYQLRGGILRYLEETRRRDNLWEGECFVFDQRVSVDRNLRPGHYELCPACRHPLSASDRQSPHYQAHVCCPNCHGSLKEEKRARMLERQKQIELSAVRREQHIGLDMQAAKARKAARRQTID